MAPLPVVLVEVGKRDAARVYLVVGQPHAHDGGDACVCGCVWVTRATLVGSLFGREGCRGMSMQRSATATFFLITRREGAKLGLSVQRQSHGEAATPAERRAQ